MQTISIIIPCRNEEPYISKAIESLMGQKCAGYNIKILIADGLSDDGTAEILEKYQNCFPDIISVYQNLQKTVPHALGILFENTSGDFIIRADAHCVYPANYVFSLVSYLRTMSADNVGGVCNTVPASDSVSSKIIANALNCKFGVGVSFRTLDIKTPVKVETVPFGAWRKDHFKKYGPFDSRFTRAQDLEHNIRVVKMGGTILCLPWLKITYFARDSFPKLKKMAFQYGYWKIPVKQKHKIEFSLRQYLPPLLVMLSLISLLCGISVSPFFFLLLVPYLLTNLVISLFLSFKNKHPFQFYLYSYAFMVNHYYYGFGYLRGIFDVYVMKQLNFAEISR